MCPFALRALGKNNVSLFGAVTVGFLLYLKISCSWAGIVSSTTLHSFCSFFKQLIIITEIAPINTRCVFQTVNFRTQGHSQRRGVTPPPPQIIFLSRHLEPQLANEASEVLEQGLAQNKFAVGKQRAMGLQM